MREFGTYFIGYARDPDVIEQMLRNMFIGDPPGNHDRILDFSTRCNWEPLLRARPSICDPHGLADPEPAEDVAGVRRPRHHHDGSLGIGGLKGASA